MVKRSLWSPRGRGLLPPTREPRRRLGCQAPGEKTKLHLDVLPVSADPLVYAIIGVGRLHCCGRIGLVHPEVEQHGYEKRDGLGGAELA
jgi:hypothetical protein